MTDDPMSPNWVPAPDDHWRGVIEVRYSDYLTPAGKARIEAARQRAAAKRPTADTTPTGPNDPPAEVRP